MNEKLYSLFESLKNDDTGLYFSLKKIYTSPTVLESDYLEDSIIYKNEFLLFLEYALFDREFSIKLTKNNCLAINNMINKWIDFYYVYKKEEEMLSVINAEKNKNIESSRYKHYLEMYDTFSSYFDKKI